MKTAFDQAKVLIIYDNFFFAEKANAIFRGTGHPADATGQWNVSSWRLDGLKLSSEADLALAEAVDARLIVFAGQRAQSLPLWLEEWLDKWVACHQVADAAFAVIGGKNGESLTMPARPNLFHFARKHGLNFVVNEYCAAEQEAQFIDHSNFKEEVSTFRTRSDSAATPAFVSHRHWGINE